MLQSQLITTSNLLKSRQATMQTSQANIDFTTLHNHSNNSNKMQETSKIKEALWQDFYALAYYKDSISSPQTIQSMAFQIPQNPQELAIILSTNIDNADIFSQSQVFSLIINNVTKSTSKSMLDIALIQAIQKHIIYSLSMTRLLALSPYFLRLNSASLISANYTRGLLRLFEAYTQKTKKTPHTQEKTLNLQALQNELESLIKQLNDIGISLKSAKILAQIKASIANQTFSIGVTGVLSAGKSTFLNALLGREILGTSTIPETANLSILRPIFADNNSKDNEGVRDFARVHFWSKQEWAQLKQAGEIGDENLSAFITNTINAFGDKLDSLLGQGSKDIDLSELKQYTSANNPIKYCNLIKKVEIFTALPFLQNSHNAQDSSNANNTHSLEIVDTPGLDDPINAREKITRQFISRCDLLIHIMNASCAATQVDMDFILECLLRQNVSRLLVVLSRADLLGQNELESSLNYTKQSLARELTKARFDGDIDALLDRIDFIPVASYFALGYSTNNAEIIAKASAQGYDKEKTGIIYISDYLKDALLGENSQKMRDILYRAYRSLKGILSTEIEQVSIELAISCASKEDLQNAIANAKDKQEQLMQAHDKQRKEFDELQNELESYLLGLEKIISTNLNTHKNRLSSLFYDDMLYEISRKSIPTKERINQMLEASVDDISADLMREYRYKIAQKIASLNAGIKMAEMHLLDFASVDLQEFRESQESNEADLGQNKLDSLASLYIPQNISSQHLKEIKSMLFSGIYALIMKYKGSSKEALQVDFRNGLDEAISEGFSMLKAFIISNNENIKMMVLSEFEALLAKVLSVIKTKISSIQNTVDKSMQAIASTDIESLKAQYNTKDKALKDIQNELDIIIKALQ